MIVNLCPPITDPAIAPEDRAEDLADGAAIVGRGFRC
jgi:hypothetical protein